MLKLSDKFSFSKMGISSWFLKNPPIGDHLAFEYGGSHFLREIQTVILSGFRDHRTQYFGLQSHFSEAHLVEISCFLSVFEKFTNW